MATTGLKLMGGAFGKSISLDELSTFFPDYFGTTSTKSVEGVYSVVPWVYRAASLRSHSLSGIPYKLIRKGAADVKEIDPPQEDNPFDKTDMLWLLYRIQMARCLWGAAFLLKRPAAKELQWLNPRTMRVENEGKRFVQVYKGVQKTYTDEQIVYLPLFNPVDDVGKGVSPAAASLTEAMLSYNASHYGEKFFEHGAVPAVILSSERFSNIPTAEIERVRKVWDRLYSGVQNAWRTAVLRFGLKPTVIGHRPRDLVMPELKDMTKQEISVAFGMSITYLEGMSTNENTDRHETLKYFLNTVIPDAELIGESMNRQLWAPLDLEWVWHFEELEVLQQYEAEKAAGLARIMAQILRVADSGILTRDRAVWVLESLLKQMSMEIPKELVDEEPPPEPAPVIAAPAAFPNAPASPTGAATGVPSKQSMGKCLEDLRLWRKVVKRHGPDREFSSEYIPSELKQRILERIAGQSPENALTFFDVLLEGKLVPLFFPKVDDEVPRDTVPTQVEVTEDEIDEAIQRWDQLFPAFAGMLEAEPRGSMDVGSAS